MNDTASANFAARPAHPTTFVIFGATGDLSARKLIPGLFRLYERGIFNESFRLVGFSRRDLSREEFAGFVREAVERARSDRDAPAATLEAFCARADYVRGDFNTSESFGTLADRLVSIDEEARACRNKLFYLSTPPEFYETILGNLADSGMTVPCSDETGWTRVLVEKPFGKNIEAARDLDRKLALLFREEQIFRIDHYLAKETIRNILMFRFSNTLFEPIWKSAYIDRIEVKLLETGGIGGRGSFYESVGALRDVGQNHLLQMLALIAMENPGSMDGEKIREERARVLSALSCAEDAADSFARAQYEGYRSEDGVAESSDVETYFRLSARIDNKRWRGTSFFLESGKALAEDRAEIAVHFTQSAPCICPPEGHEPHGNMLRFLVRPEAGIKILFWAKKPGLTNDLEVRDLSFLYNDQPAERDRTADAYVKILHDAAVGDQMLFTSTEEVMAAWRFITHVREIWQELPLRSYPRGSSSGDI